MNDIWFEKIDKYLSGEMSAKEKRFFESELAANRELSDTFNLYKAIETKMGSAQKYRTEAAQLRTIMATAHAQFTEDSKGVSVEPKEIALWQSKPFRVALSIAASVLVIVLSYVIFFDSNQNAQQLASNYINQNLTHISQKMSGSGDSLQQGITAYNNKAYNRALQLFASVLTNDPTNRDATEYTGYVYLINKDYDKALLLFEELAEMGGRFNQGVFLKAVTLLQRNKEGDEALAKQLLQQVVNEKGGGNVKAAEWLKKL